MEISVARDVWESFTNRNAPKLTGNARSPCKEYVALGVNESSGYPYFVGLDGGIIDAHRLLANAYPAQVSGHKPAPPSVSIIMHTCDNRKCLNINHLRWGTHAENMVDRNLSGRTAVGEAHGSSKLKSHDITIIKSLLEMRVPQRKIAAAFGVSQNTIKDINTGKNWKYHDQ